MVDERELGSSRGHICLGRDNERVSIVSLYSLHRHSLDQKEWFVYHEYELFHNIWQRQRQINFRPTMTLLSSRRRNITDMPVYPQAIGITKHLS